MTRADAQDDKAAAAEPATTQPSLLKRVLTGLLVGALVAVPAILIGAAGASVFGWATGNWQQAWAGLGRFSVVVAVVCPAIAIRRAVWPRRRVRG